jgi:molecular chaperone DnaK (HSP70)
MDYLNSTKDLGKARVGIDFGSTNTSISYFSENSHEIKEDIVFKNRRVSLFANDNKNNNEKPAVEDEIFFFQFYCINFQCI